MFLLHPRSDGLISRQAYLTGVNVICSRRFYLQVVLHMMKVLSHPLRYLTTIPISTTKHLTSDTQRSYNLNESERVHLLRLR